MNAVAVVTGTAALILSTGALVKFVDRDRFRTVVADLEFIGPAGPFLSGVVPLVELTVGVLLLLSTRVSLFLGLAAALFAAFSVVSARSKLVDCGCGPFVPKRTTPRVVLSLLLAALCIIAAMLQITPSVGDRLLGFGMAAVTAMGLNVVLGIRAEWASRPTRALEPLVEEQTPVP